MNIIFSNHALLKVRQRNLSKVAIITTIKKPDRIESTYGGREALFKKFRKHSLKVVIVREHGAAVVVTAHWVA